MPQPTQSQVHVDAILTNLSIAYMQDQSRFISRQVFPMISVDKQSDLYYIYNKNDWFRDEAEPRADSTESAGSGYNLSTDNYNARVYAVHKDVGNQVAQNTDRPLDPYRDATNFVTMKMLLRQENQWVSDYFAPSVWDTDFTPANTWDDKAASDPIDDVELGKEIILSTTGHMPNTLVLGYQVYRQLKQHPDIIDRIKYTEGVTGRTISPQLLAQMFDVDRVLVAMAIRATNAEGAAATYAFAYGKHALLCYVNPTPSLMAPSAGYGFTWKGVSKGLGLNVGISRFPMRELDADRIEAQMAWDNKVVATDLGYFFENVVA